MHDLPSQTLLQQASARAVSGEELEVFGKAAASRFMKGASSSLNDAVVETVKHAGLSPEQVKRVIEFTNTAAYLHEFKKEGAAHRYIHFHGGPASPSEVLKDLNNGGGGTVFDRGMVDYSQPPPNTKTASAAPTAESEELEKAAALGIGLDVVDLGTRMVEEKTASDPVEQAFLEMFQVEEQPIPYAEPWAEVEAMREKLATTRDNLNSDLSMLEGEFRDITEQLYGLVKQAALEGVPLGHVVEAWASVTPGEGFVKAAFSHIGPRLAQEQVMSLDGLGESLTKKASIGETNMNHPLVGTFAGFCSHLMKLAETREQRDICHREFERVDGFCKKANAGLVKSIKGSRGLWGGAKDLARKAAYGTDPNELGGVQGAVRKAGQFVLGDESKAVDLLSRGAGKVTQYSPHLGLAGGAAITGQEISDQLTYNPKLQPIGRALRGVKRTGLSYVPGSDASLERQSLIARGGFGPTSMMAAYS